jgi:DNA invertase Pin-like site-specific DNA recombinase
LAEAKEAAVANAPCVLIVQDVDRLARGAGDAPGAADHLRELFFQLRRQRVTIWSARTGEVDSIRAVLEGERSHSESQRKSQATRSGIKRRKARGAPVGPIPFGYRVERDVVAGQVIASRVVNPDRAAVITEIFAAIATGASPGDAARMLNARGVRTQRGKTWTARAVRQLVANPAYRGERGYPRLVPDALYAKGDGVAAAARPRRRSTPAGRSPAER